MDDELLEEELKSQINASQAVVQRLEQELRDTEESLELQAAVAEARRMRADRATAAIQREQAQLMSAGLQHTSAIVKWWLSGLILSWMMGITFVLSLSPVLAYTTFVPMIVASLVLGYANSSVEMKIFVNDMKRASRARGASLSGVARTDYETEAFIGELLGEAPQPASDDGGSRMWRSASGQGGLGWKVLVGTAKVMYGTTRAMTGVAKYALGIGGKRKQE